MRALLAAILLCAFSLPAAAHGRYRHRMHARHHHIARHAPVDMKRLLHNARETPLVRTALKYVGSRNPTSFRGGPWCGAYAEWIARKVGVRTPPNPKLAANWAKAGPHVAPQPGAVMVMPHHVGFVMAVVGPFVELVSGNHGNRVGVGMYPIRRAIAFVQPLRS